MKPYFGTSHLAGLLLLIASPGWGATAAAQPSDHIFPITFIAAGVTFSSLSPMVGQAA
jgi:hypothetical protein